MAFIWINKDITLKLFKKKKLKLFNNTHLKKNYD